MYFIIAILSLLIGYCIGYFQGKKHVIEQGVSKGDIKYDSDIEGKPVAMFVKSHARIW